MASQKSCIYNGREVSAGWPNEVEKAQKLGEFLIEKKRYRRIAYGNESSAWGADTMSCHDCAVVKGQIHVQGCDVERCPRCGGQSVFCPCSYEGMTNKGSNKVIPVLHLDPDTLPPR